MALLHAYAQRCLMVGPITRSASSANGTAMLLPYTSDVEKIIVSLPFLRAVLEDDLRAVHVGLDRAHRGFDDELDADGGGEMEHDIGAVDELGRERLVHDRVDHVVETRPPLEVGDVVHRPRGQIVDDHDVMASGEQGVGQMGSDESGAAGEQCFHVPRFAPCILARVRASHVRRPAGCAASARISAAARAAACPSDRSS